MCGIAGILYADPQRRVPADMLDAMGDAIAHRGPDGSGTLRAGPVGLVHRRLSIIDLEGGRQPIASEDESVHVVFNGEIYNYRALRTQLEARGHVFRTNSDTEVLVHLYEDHGEDLCRLLRGMFAFAIWDARRQRLLLARDHLGQKPLYLYRDAEQLLFASELKAILTVARVDRTISPEAVEDYLTFGFVPGQRSIFTSIQKLPASHHVLVSTSDLHTLPRRYWQLNFDHERAGSLADWKEQLTSALRDSVQAHLVADVPVGAFLSGGLDSSSIVAVMSELRADPVRTFSIGFEESEFSELPHAREVARHFHCQHTEEVVTPDAARDLDDLVFLYDEPFADASAIPTMAVSRLAAAHVKVVLSGDGGDELLGGYSRYAHDLNEDRLRQFLPSALRSTLLRPLSVVWPRADWLPRPLRLKSLLQNLATSPAEAYAHTVSACRDQVRSLLLQPDVARRAAGHRPEQIIIDAFQSGQRDTLSGMLAADTSVLLPDDFLTKVDRASMGFGLEVRPPFIDWPLMELAASMPSDFKIRNGSKKWILKQLFTSRLPSGLAHRRKQGFELPIDAWLRGPLRDQFHSCVLDSSSPIGSFINTTAAGRLFTSHGRGTGRHGQVLWSLLVFARWLNAWAQPTVPVRANQRRQEVVST